MDLKGFEIITKSLEQVEDAEVWPMPTEGQNVRFLSIEVPAYVRAEDILNFLDAASLVKRISSETGINRNPNLHVLGIIPGSITFEDTNFRR